MKTYNVFHNDKFLESFIEVEKARRYVAHQSGKPIDWATRYEGYQIKHGVAPKRRGKV